MTECMGGCVDTYRTACGQPDLKLRKVDTPFIPTADGAGNAPAELVEGGKAGVLAPVACAVLMKLMYGARMALWDLLKVIQALSTRLTKWSEDTDSSATSTPRETGC